jgi:HD superfamily phosphohydrolase YqeK
MEIEKMFEMATQYLEKNDFRVAHTKRVFNMAKQNFMPKPELLELTYAAIILHDIGGSSIKDQYEKGSKIVTITLKKLNCSDYFISQICKIISTHHEHPEHASEPFKILYDADKPVMFSPQEFSIYNSRMEFDWNKIIDLIFSQKGKVLAKKMLAQRRMEITKG